MALGSIIFLSALLVLGVSSSSSNKKACIKGKYEESLGQPFTSCYATNQGLEIPRMKQCYQDIMKTEQVVQTSSNGQMTVDRQKFGEYATQHNTKPVGRAMKTCYDDNGADSEMYQEAARATQCVFNKLKATC